MPGAVFRRLELRVSDVVVAEGQLPRRSGTVQAPESGGLFLGGVPPELASALSITPPAAFDGCISDVIFGNRCAGRDGFTHSWVLRARIVCSSSFLWCLIHQRMAMLYDNVSSIFIVESLVGTNIFDVK